MIKFFLIILLLANSAMSSFPLFELQTPNNQALELIERKTKAFVEGPYAEIQYIETYKNPFTNPIEAKFLFHRSQDYLFNKFEVIIANQTILYEVHEKPINVERTNQIEIYPHQAKVTSDLIEFHLGQILPNQTAQIILSVAQPLQVHLFKFYELRLSATHQNLKEWNIEVEIRSDRPLEILSNPTHQLKPILSQPTPSLYLTFYKATLTLDKDFIVYFAPENLPKLQISSAIHPDNPTDHLVLFSAVPDAKYFSPEFVQNVLESQPENGLLELYKKAFKIEMNNSLSQYILMLDRSDSMKGESLENLKKGVLALLRTLPESHEVDILSFGSTFEFYRPDKKFHRQLPTAREAMEWVEGIEADMGEKDLLRSFEDIVKDYGWGEFGHQAIIIFTDGSNSDEILEMIYSSDRTRVCTVGINQRASLDIIQSLNQESRCQGEFVIDDQDLDERAFRFMKENFMISTYFIVNFDVECHNSQNQLVYEDHLAEEGVFMDRPWVRWIYLDKNVDFKSCKLDLYFYDCYEDIDFDEKMTIYEMKDAKMTDSYHKIAYGMKINELKKEKERSRPQYHNGINLQIINFSTRYQIPSELTVLLPRVQKNIKRVGLQQPPLFEDL